MEIPDPVFYLVFILSGISSTMYIITFTYNHRSKIKFVSSSMINFVPWSKIANRTMRILRFIGFITAAGALVTMGMFVGSLALDGIDILADTYSEYFDSIIIPSEIHIGIYIIGFVILAILLGYFLTLSGSLFNALGMYPKSKI